MLRSRLSFLGLTILLLVVAACSSPVSPGTPPTGPSDQGRPSKPANFKVSKSGAGFLLQWDAVPGASGYKLLRTGAGGPVTPSEPKYYEDGVKSGDKVEYSVWARSGSVQSDALVVTVTMPDSGTVTPPQPQPLGKPANLRVSASSGGFLLEWDGVSGATGYKLQRTGAGPINLSSTSYLETAVKAGDKAEYSLWATNGSTTSAALVATLTMPAASSPPPANPPQPSPPPANPPTGVSLVSTNYAASDAVFPNPERGFNTNIDFPLTSNPSSEIPFGPGTTCAADSYTSFEWFRQQAAHVSVMRVFIRLDNYRWGDLDSGFLDCLDRSFAAIRRDAYYKLMLRFMYNYSGNAADASLGQVTRHISQLRPILQNNADLIVAVQAGFIGSWGEWHDSQNGLNSRANKQTILNALLDALPANRMVLLRAPLDHINIYPQALGAGQAFSGSNQARVGSHNDCFLSDATDTGTWDGLGQYSISQLQSYIQQTSQYTPMGGETCEGTFQNSLSDCPSAISALQKYHWDMMNMVYYDGGWYFGDFPKWVNQGCMDTVKRKLGYRFQLGQSQIPTQVKPGGEFYMTFTLSNVGWGKVFNPRTLEAILRHKSSGKVYRLAVSADPRTWAPGSTVTVTVNGGIPSSAPTGDYDVMLNLPDPAGTLYGKPAYSIRLANQNVWEASTGFNSLLRTVNVNTSAGGSNYSGSSWFQ